MLVYPTQGIVPLDSVETRRRFLPYQEHEEPLLVREAIHVQRVLCRRLLAGQRRAPAEQNQARAVLAPKNLLLFLEFIAPAGIFFRTLFPREPGGIVGVPLVLRGLLDCLDGSIELQIEMRAG